ncbi:CIC11C00000002017 [Sungouiella intermedia]|uniref:CIC11C00000002017 n=1 Tax=Sungouiella intermedia TaxID=45354 RepID=A0A1L0DRN1_9ASCO|nr:CIC11C00000002017 [[Candida] intermedia]
MDTILQRARALLQSSQEQKALDLLAPAATQNPENPAVLELFGQALLEVNDVESAYSVLSKAVELDPEANHGVDKFLYLGQIIGGRDGCQYLDVALAKLQTQLEKVASNSQDDPALVELAKVYPTSEELSQYLIKKLNQGIFAEIEIWMTDLCMEPEAEDQCDKLISHSLALDDTNPEALSLLALIRISQQRNDDARHALLQSWEHFQHKKQNLEINQAEGGEEASFEYIELVQPLLGLARFAIELSMYDVVPAICSSVADINDNALDCFYYEALSHLLKAKLAYHNKNPSEDDYRELGAAVVAKSEDPEIQAAIAEAKLALTQGYRVINSADAEASDPDVVDQVNEMLQELGGPVMSELMPERRNDDDEEGWEDEIVSDEE